jgi:hypothetical protein
MGDRLAALTIDWADIVGAVIETRNRKLMGDERAPRAAPPETVSLREEIWAIQMMCCPSPPLRPQRR